MKKRMWMAGLLAVAMVLSLLVSCGAENDTSGAEQSDDGSSSAVIEASSEADVSEDVSSFVSEPEESSVVDESEPIEGSSEAADPVESSVADETSSGDVPIESSEPAESSAAGTSSESETSKPQPTGTGTHKHSYKDTVVKPTCTEKGYTLHKCSCGDSYTDNEIEALGHLMIVRYGGRRPTATERGSTKIGCDNCDYYEDHEIYSYNEATPLIAERVLYYLNLYRKEAGVAPVALSDKLTEYARYRSMQTYSHDKEEQQAAANATQCGDFFEYSDTSWWTINCAEVIDIPSGDILVDTGGHDILDFQTADGLAKSVIADYKWSSAHWKILMKPDYTYIGVGNDGHNCIVLCKKSYDDGYNHTWDFGDGNYGSEWVPR